MKRFAHLAAILMLLVLSAPLMACVTSVSMTPAEQMCCESMHGHCGQKPGHHCCQTEVRTDRAQLPAATVHAPEPLLAHLPSLAVWEMPVSFSVAYPIRYSLEHPPPGQHHLLAIVLRI